MQTMLKRAFSILITLIGLTCLSGCTGETCIDADDFGYPSLYVSARYSKEELSEQFGETQVAPWRDSNLQVNGRPLTIVVRNWDYNKQGNRKGLVSAWSPWYGQEGDDKKLSKISMRFAECKFIDDQMCTNSKNARIANAPCVLKKGVGLYALIAEPGTDPNWSISSQRDPAGITFHVGAPRSGYALYDIANDGTVEEAGGRVYQYDTAGVDSFSAKRKYADSKLYFKINDRFYDDNAGGYRISIKSGVTYTNPDPIAKVIQLVQELMFGKSGKEYGLIQKLFNGIVSNQGYKMTVSALLILYVMYIALSFISGNKNIKQTELVYIIGKIGIISVLIGTNWSWNFFYDYLFVFFVGGIQQILQIITEAGATGPGAPGILSLMIAPQTMAKLFSLLFVDWKGFIYIALFLFALYFVVYIYIHAAVIYLTAIMVVGVIIAMFPIFACFALFEYTRSLYNRWFAQLISYSCQPVILFVGLIFVSTIIRTEIYGSLGYRVCKHSFPKLTEVKGALGNLPTDTLGFDVGGSMFYWFFPDPMKGKNFSRTKATIPIPIDHWNENDEFCEAYACMGERYVDLPFLDPKKDKRRISAFWNGHFVQFDGLLLIFVALYLLHKFNGIAVGIANQLTKDVGGVSLSHEASMEGVADKAMSDIKAGVSAPVRYVKRQALDTKVGRKVSSTIIQAKDTVKQIKSIPVTLFDNAMINKLKKKALSSPNKAVLEEVERVSGLRHSDLNIGATKRYKEALSQSLRQIDSSLSQKQANKIAGKMAKIEPSKLKEELAKAKYGKKYGDLADHGKEEINKLLRAGHQGISLRQLSIDAAEERRFQNAYVEAHQRLSNRGIGLFGKSSKGLRSLQEINARAKERARARELQKFNKTDRLMSDFAEAKRGVFKKLTGKEARDSAIGAEYFGGDYAQIDRRDPALRTRQETLEHEERQRTWADAKRNLKDINKEKRDNVVSPEFLTKARLTNDKDLAGYQELARQDIKYKVWDALGKDEDPIMKGDTYLRNHAKDSELVEIVDRLKEKQEDLINKQDEFTSRYSDYEAKVLEAEERIAAEHRYLSEKLGRSNITAGELPTLLQQDLGVPSTKEERKEVQNRVQYLTRSIENYEIAQEYMNSINERKQMIAEEINERIEHINEIRKSVGMEKYYGKGKDGRELTSIVPPKNQYKARVVRKIEDHVRNLR